MTRSYPAFKCSLLEKCKSFETKFTTNDLQTHLLKILVCWFSLWFIHSGAGKRGRTDKDEERFSTLGKGADFYD